MVQYGSYLDDGVKQPVTEEPLGSLALRLTWVVVQFNVQGNVVKLCVEITLTIHSLKSLASQPM